MTANDDLKIPLQQPPFSRYGQHNYNLGPAPRAISKSLPIYFSRYGKMCHRVRSGHLHWTTNRVAWQGGHQVITGGKNEAHISLSLWCGQSGSIGKGQLMAVPPDRVPLCGTCEGRAVGAGYPGIAILQQRYALLYSPREGRLPEQRERQEQVS